MVRLTAKTEDSSLLQNSHTGPLAHPTPYSFENLGSSTTLKGPECGTGHLFPTVWRERMNGAVPPLLHNIS